MTGCVAEETKKTFAENIAPGPSRPTLFSPTCTYLPLFESRPKSSCFRPRTTPYDCVGNQFLYPKLTRRKKRSIQEHDARLLAIIGDQQRSQKPHQHEIYIWRTPKCLQSSSRYCCHNWWRREGKGKAYSIPKWISHPHSIPRLQQPRLRYRHQSPQHSLGKGT